MDKKTTGRTLLVLNVIAFAAATWNAIDEAWILDTWGNIVFIVGLWMVVPVANTVIATVTQKPTRRRVCVILTILYAALYTFYALNGSTQTGPEGAQHMHLIMLPPLLLILTGGIHAIVSVLTFRRGYRTV